ncbi:hypothetical protein HDZ31DRAFT_79329 [Schizophyllum fasciatum]
MPPKPVQKPRSWGSRFDALPPSSPPSVIERDFATEPPQDSTPKRENKMPHDASVFVGSLPTNVEQPELARLLSEHLSEHAEVQNVKVVRDAKGGVCAFVQCEDAAAATNLINTLHSTPSKPFLGRILRYEPARAFRTLLVSYRTPKQLLPSIQPRDGGAEQATSEQLVDLDVPFAMRIWKSRASKFYNMQYNSDALEGEARSKAIQQQVENYTDNSIYFHPVGFDVETIRALATFFGQLESFGPYKVSEDAGSEPSENQPYPAPHDAERLPNMNTGCYEIKWAHRDDCVTALMTLRRVPHLTVTWAHQPQSQMDRVLHGTPRQPQMANTASYPLHVLSPRRDFQSTLRAACDRQSGSPTRGAANSITPPAGTFLGDLRSSSLQSNVAQRSKAGVRDIDFPPLQEGGERADPRLAWDGSDATDASLPVSPFVPSSDAVVEAAHREELDEHEQVLEMSSPRMPGLGMSPITPKTPGTQFPITPTSSTMGMDGLPFGYDGKEREIDPTTLFVGGLEMHGPSAWDEERVGNLFAKYGGLQSVKVVRPANSRAAFAFVKFNNLEAPARAIGEEHNRVYDGRAIRVQLRDCNPPRSPWKQRRGRQPFMPSQPFIEGMDHGGASNSPFGDYIDDRSRVESLAKDFADATLHVDDDLKSRARVHQRTASDIHDGSIASRRTESVARSEGRPPSAHAPTISWADDTPASAMSPPPSSLSSAPSSTVPSLAPPAFVMPNGAYYPPLGPWMAPAFPPMQYAMPYYAPYPQPPVGQAATPAFASPIGSDASGPTASPPVAWPPAPMYASYMPYPAYQRPPGEQPAVAAQQLPASGSPGQAPLAPTGFVQDGQGTLIPVYHPEALDQYMSNHPPGSRQLPFHPASSQPWYPHVVPHGGQSPHAAAIGRPPPSQIPAQAIPWPTSAYYPTVLPSAGHTHTPPLGPPPTRVNHDTATAGMNRRPGRKDHQPYRGTYRPFGAHRQSRGGHQSPANGPVYQFPAVEGNQQQTSTMHARRSPHAEWGQWNRPGIRG